MLCCVESCAFFCCWLFWINDLAFTTEQCEESRALRMKKLLLRESIGWYVYRVSPFAETRLHPMPLLRKLHENTSFVFNKAKEKNNIAAAILSAHTLKRGDLFNEPTLHKYAASRRLREVL